MVVCGKAVMRTNEQSRMNDGGSQVKLIGKRSRQQLTTTVIVKLAMKGTVVFTMS